MKTKGELILAKPRPQLRNKGVQGPESEGFVGVAMMSRRMGGVGRIEVREGSEPKCGSAKGQTWHLCMSISSRRGGWATTASCTLIP